MSVPSKDRLALLLAFAKVILLERGAAESVVRELLVDEALGRRGEVELFRRLALACYARAPLSRTPAGPAIDPLADPLLGDFTPGERAELFLTLRCGFAAGLASSVAAPVVAVFHHAA